jgi:hypothetical protein
MQRDLATLLNERPMIFAEYQRMMEDGRGEKQVMPEENVIPNRVQAAVPSEPGL